MHFENESFTRAYRDTFMFGTSYAPYALGEDWPREEWEPAIRRFAEILRAEYGLPAVAGSGEKLK